MKIYVIEQYDLECSYVVAAFTSKEKALKAIIQYEEEDRKNGSDWSYGYTEIEVQ